MALARLEDEHAIRPINSCRIAGCQAISIVSRIILGIEECEFGTILRHTILVDLRHTKLTLLIRNVKDRTEVADELGDVEGCEATVLEAIWIGIDLLYELVDAISWLAVIRIHCAHSHPPERIVAFGGAHSANLIFRNTEHSCERIRLDQRVIHSHVTIGVGENVAVGASRKILQRAFQAARLVVPIKMPAFGMSVIEVMIGTIMFSGLHERSG